MKFSPFQKEESEQRFIILHLINAVKLLLLVGILPLLL